MPLLRPFLKDRENFSEAERVSGYGDWVVGINLVNELRGANLAVLPLSFNFYKLQDQTDKALAFIDKAQEEGVPILAWISGDFGVTPVVKDVMVYRSSGYQSQRLSKQFAFPVFFEDPLLKNFHTNEIVVRSKGDKPVVGFCGQAYAPLHKNVYDYFRTLLRNVSFYLKYSPFEPQSLYPSTLLRKKIIEYLQKHPSVQTNFIIRNAYRAGAKSAAEKERTSMEYYQNMMDSDYIVCVRGNGNFSARLYETLAMGRIPIIINTDCIYPWDDILDWKKIGVWVERNEVSQIADIVSAFHSNISDVDFAHAQINARRIWVEHLSMSGFFSTLLRKFE